MKDSRILNRLRDSNMLWAVTAVLISVIINFSLVPYVTERVGVEAYGYVSLANTMVTYVDVIAIALNAFACRFIAIEYHKADFSEANKYYSSVFYANIIFCLVMAGFAFYLIPNLQNLINILPEYEVSVKILFVLVILRYFCTLIRTVFEVGAFIKNRIDLTEKIKSVSYVIQAFLLIGLCVFLSPQIWYVGVATFAATLVQLALQIKLGKKLTPELKLSKSNWSGNCIKNLLSTGIWNAINNVGNLLNSGLDLLIANEMLAAVMAGMISVSKTLGSTCYTVVTAISNSFRPKQLECYSNGDINGLVYLLKRSMRITGAFCAVVIAGFWVCGKKFLELWIPTQNINMIFQLTMIVLLGEIMIGVVNPLYYVFTLTKKLTLPCFITIFMGAANVISMYFLIKFTPYGDYAVVLTTMVINFIHFFDTPIYSAYCLKISIKTFYPTILLHLFATVLLCGIATLINLVYPEVTNWIGLLLKITVFGIIEMVIAFLVMTDKDEKKTVILFLSKKTKG